MSGTSTFIALPAVSVSLCPTVSSSTSSFVATVRPTVAPVRSAALNAAVDSGFAIRAQATDVTATAEAPTLTIREDVVSIACVAHVDHGKFGQQT
jgi:hypothetical protein